MVRRPFGSSGLTVSALGLGCGRLGSVVSREADRAAEAAVRRALACGITFFDTADCYGRGRSEAILGRAVRPTRDGVVVVTKCGLVRTPGTVLNALRTSPGLLGPAKTASGLLRDRRSYRTYSSPYVERAAESSLRRLGFDHLDVLLLHSPPASVLRDQRFMDAFENLRAAGKVRLCGVSVRGGTESVRDALTALAIPGLDCLELELNLCEAGAVETVLPAAGERGVAVIARQPFGSGSLLGRADISPQAVVEACLQFALGVSGVSVVIAGMTRPEHVSANVEAAAGALPAEEIQRVRDLLC